MTLVEIEFSINHLDIVCVIKVLWFITNKYTGRWNKCVNDSTSCHVEGANGLTSQCGFWLKKGVLAPKVTPKIFSKQVERFQCHCVQTLLPNKMLWRIVLIALLMSSGKISTNQLLVISIHILVYILCA